MVLTVVFKKIKRCCCFFVDYGDIKVFAVSDI